MEEESQNNVGGSGGTSSKAQGKATSVVSLKDFESEKTRATSTILRPDAATSAVLVVEIAKELILGSRDERIAELANRNS